MSCNGRGPRFTPCRPPAGELGISAEEVAQAWGLLGLTVAGPDIPALSQADVDALATWLALKTAVSEDGALGCCE